MLATLMSVLIASSAVAAKHGYGGWQSHHNLLIFDAIILVAVGAILYIRGRSGSYVVTETDPVQAALEARLNDLEQSDYSEICFRLAERSSAHQGALDDVLREIESTKDDGAEA
jgi:hypothetical protein